MDDKKKQVIMPTTISKYVIHKVTTWSALRRQLATEEAALNQQQNEECQQNSVGDGEKQKDLSNNVTPSTSPPFIVC